MAFTNFFVLTYILLHKPYDIYAFVVTQQNTFDVFILHVHRNCKITLFVNLQKIDLFKIKKYFAFNHV